MMIPEDQRRGRTYRLDGMVPPDEYGDGPGFFRAFVNGSLADPCNVARETASHLKTSVNVFEIEDHKIIRTVGTFNADHT